MVCVYCDCIVPEQKFRTIGNGKGKVVCTEHFNQWRDLKIAKKTAIKILDIAKCNLGICRKEIKNTFQVEKMRDIIARMMGNIEKSAKKILRKSTSSIKKILTKLKRLANIFGLKNEYTRARIALTV